MVNMTARQTPYTDASRSAFLGTLFAHHRCIDYHGSCARHGWHSSGDITRGLL
eukprot:COSAG01_NODE_4718_length_4794_cov_363.209585_8_plen_53_part_00